MTLARVSRLHLDPASVLADVVARLLDVAMDLAVVLPVLALVVACIALAALPILAMAALVPALVATLRALAVMDELFRRFAPEPVLPNVVTNDRRYRRSSVVNVLRSAPSLLRALPTLVRTRPRRVRALRTLRRRVLRCLRLCPIVLLTVPPTLLWLLRQPP